MAVYEELGSDESNQRIEPLKVAVDEWLGEIEALPNKVACETSPRFKCLLHG